MINIQFDKKKEFLPLILILVLIFTRLIPHPPNFTPIIAVSLMSGYLFKNLNFAMIVLLSVMIFSDLIIGFHGSMFFVYISLLIIQTYFFKKFVSTNYLKITLYAFTASTIFFIISNFGVWIIGNLYPKNLNGFISCYTMALPFFKNTIFSTLIYSSLIYFFKNYFFINFKNS